VDSIIHVANSYAKVRVAVCTCVCVTGVHAGPAAERSSVVAATAA